LSADGVIGTGPIANSAVTFAKMQPINSGAILGRSTAGNGVVEMLALGGGLSLSAGVLSSTTSSGSLAFTPTGNISSTTVQEAIAELDAEKIPVSEKGAAGGVATLDGSGKVPSSQIPPIAITETYPVASEAEMLALDVQVGDVAVRSDIAVNFILRYAPPTSPSNWLALAAPASSVSSVAGQIGVVTAAQVSAALNALLGGDRISYNALKDTPSLSFTANAESLSGNKALLASSEYYQTLSPGGANRDISLHPGWTGIIVNDSDGTYALNLKDGATTILSLSAADNFKAASIWHDGTDYNILQEATFSQEDGGAPEFASTKTKNIESISATKTLILTDAYFQFLTPVVASVVVKLPDVISTDYFECEIVNDHATNIITLQEFGGTGILALSSATTDKVQSVYIFWDGSIWRVFERSFY
jgi:hypothetical protein